MGDVIIRHANYGLELVDELTNGPLVSTSSVSFEPVGPLVPGSGPTVFTVGDSRWVYENLEQDVTFAVSADHYLSRELETGTDLPAVPGDDVAGVLASVSMKPAPGYPFPPSLTRAIGSVRLAAAVDATKPPIPGAEVTITPMHDLASGTDFVTFSDDSGQYAVWFLPDPSQSPPWATGFTASAQATVDIGGTPTLVTGNISLQTLILQTSNGAETIYLHP